MKMEKTEQKGTLKTKGTVCVVFECPHCKNMGQIPNPRAVSMMLLGGGIELECHGCKGRLIVDNENLIAVPVPTPMPAPQYKKAQLPGCGIQVVR